MVEDTRQKLTHFFVVVNHQDRSPVIALILRQLIQFLLETVTLRRGHHCRFFGDKINIGSEMFLTRVEHDRHRCAFAYLALHLYVTVVQIHQLFGQVHSDTGTGDVVRVQLVVARETLKQNAPFIRRYTDSFVLYR